MHNGGAPEDLMLYSICHYNDDKTDVSVIGQKMVILFVLGAIIIVYYYLQLSIEA